MKGQVEIVGLAQLQAALKLADREAYDGIRSDLKTAGELVAADARSRLMPKYPPSASTIRGRAKGASTAVAEQTRRRTTGQHPFWGTYQMTRDLMPALDAKSPEVVAVMEHTLDRVADHFNA